MSAFASAWGALRGWTDRLGARLAVILAIALAPLLFVIVLQSRGALEAARMRGEAALLGETLGAAETAQRVVQDAQAVARLLAAQMPQAAASQASCAALMDQAAATLPEATLVAYVPLDGRMRCASGGRSADFAASPAFQAVAASDAPTFSASRYGQISKTSIISVSEPVRDAAGARSGFVTVSLPHDRLVAGSAGGPTPGAAGRTGSAPLDLVIFSREGDILSATHSPDATRNELPDDVDLAALAAGPVAAFSAQAADGARRAYAVAALIPGRLFAIGAWPESALGVASLWSAPEIWPLLMWAGSVLIAYIAIERMALRHMRRLARALGDFASGGRMVIDLDVAGAPREIRDLAESYDKMTETILRDEAELEDMIHQKEVLLREVHHRVKNNLQLISSIINMQMRRTLAPETRGLLRGLQDRVLSLATVHRGLYMASGLTEIDAAALTRDVTRQLARAAGRDESDIALSADALDLAPDQAVPLSLLLTEALNRAMKAQAGAGPDRTPGEVAVTLRHDPGHRVSLVIAFAVPPAAAPAPAAAAAAAAAQDEADGLGMQLIAAFASQLGGALDVTTKNGREEIRLAFVARGQPRNEFSSSPPLREIA